MTSARNANAAALKPKANGWMKEPATRRFFCVPVPGKLAILTNNEGAPMLTFKQKLELQKLIIAQNKILAGSPTPAERIQAERIKRDAFSKLGIAQEDAQGGVKSYALKR
jgi:hypothetical protein